MVEIPNAYQNKFGEFGGYQKVKDDDPFGYVVQGFSYAEGENMPFGGWIVMDKSSGEITVCEAPSTQAQEKKEALEAATVNVRKLKKTKRVEKQSSIYKKQLSQCRNSLNKNKYIIF